MDSTLQLKESLLETIVGINDRSLIESISNFVKKKIGKKSSTAVHNAKDNIEVAPEVWNIIKRIHPVNEDNDRAEYNDYLDRKYQ